MIDPHLGGGRTDLKHPTDPAALTSVKTSRPVPPAPAAHLPPRSRLRCALWGGMGRYGRQIAPEPVSARRAPFLAGFTTSAVRRGSGRPRFGTDLKHPPYASSVDANPKGSSCRIHTRAEQTPGSASFQPASGASGAQSRSEDTGSVRLRKKNEPETSSRSTSHDADPDVSCSNDPHRVAGRGQVFRLGCRAQHDSGSIAGVAQCICCVGGTYSGGS